MPYTLGTPLSTLRASVHFNFSAQVVKKFVDGMGSQMDYTVALDTAGEVQEGESGVGMPLGLGIS